MTAAPEAGRSSTARLASLLFLARFLVLVVALYLALAWRPVNDRAVLPFTARVASLSGAALTLLGEPVRVAGTTISGGGFGVDIENGCNGLETAILFVSAVLAFPASWRAKLLGVAGGFLAIQAVNLVRVVTLFWVGRHHPAVFQASHGVIWQSLVVLFGVVLFFVWAARQPKPSAAES
jgi:exosortase H (IPTLxxWG-CTERM-specific)